MGDDKYLERLDHLLDSSERISKIGRAKEAYKSGLVDGGKLRKGYRDHYNLGWARRTINQSAEGGDVYGALSAAGIYESYGKGGKPIVKTKLLDSLSKAISGGESVDEDAVNQVREFLKRNPTKSNALEKTASGVVAVAGVLGGLFLIAPTINGNVVGNVGGTPGSLWGVIALVVGMLGAYVFFRE